MTEDQTNPGAAGTPDIQIKTPTSEAPEDAAGVASISEPSTPAPAPATPELPPTEIPEVQAPEIVKPPAQIQEPESTQPDSSILDDPQPTNSEDGFFKKNKMLIIGGVVVLIVITVVVGILLSIKNADKLEGKLRLLESQQDKQDLPVIKGAADADTGTIDTDTLDTAPTEQPKTMPNVTPLFKAK